MRAWTILLGGLVVWTAHFFALYAIASVLPGQGEARWWVLAATFPALAANGLILWKTIGPGNNDPLDRWIARVGAGGAALSLLAVIWQALPALMI